MTTLPASLYHPIPPQREQWVHRFARDLALGVIHGAWSPDFLVMFYGNGVQEWSATDAFHDYVLRVWWLDQDDPSSDNMPKVDELLFWGYMAHVSGERYQLTDAARTLAIDDPSQVSTPFISYKRNTSSAVAMLIWSFLQRFRLNPFLDVSDITAGTDWQARIDAELSACDSVIVVLTTGTLDSTYVQYELEQAIARSIPITPIIHGDYTPQQLAAVDGPLGRLHALVIEHPERSDQLLGVLERLRFDLGIVNRRLP